MQFEMRQQMQNILPNTHNALTWLVPALEKAAQNLGKKSLFGKDKFTPAYEMVVQHLGTCISSMAQDGIIGQSMSAAEVEEEFFKVVTFFSNAYPNWQDGYAFFKAVFIDQNNSDLHQIINYLVLAGTDTDNTIVKKIMSDILDMEKQQGI